MSFFCMASESITLTTFIYTHITHNKKYPIRNSQRRFCNHFGISHSPPMSYDNRQHGLSNLVVRLLWMFGFTLPQETALKKKGRCGGKKFFWRSANRSPEELKENISRRAVKVRAAESGLPGQGLKHQPVGGCSVSSCSRSPWQYQHQESGNVLPSGFLRHCSDLQ